MEMESLDTSNQAETAEPGPSSQPASYRNTQVWKDIEAETGFTSYEDYLKYYEDAHPKFKFKLAQLHDNQKKLRSNGSARMETFIYDLSIQENSSSGLSLRCRYDTGTELIQTLRKPPNGVCVQLVLWFRTPSPLNQETVDTLGLGLRLDLDDFDYRELWSPLPRKSGPRIKSIFGEQTVAAVCHGFMRDVANEVPVVLVAYNKQTCCHTLLGSVFVADYCEPPPFCKSPRVIMPFKTAGHGLSLIEVTSLDYARAVQHFIVQGQDVHPTKQSLLLAAISPLLYAEECCMTDCINKVQAIYTSIVFGVSDDSGESRVSQEHLDQNRTELRRITERNEDILGQFSRYLASEGHSDLSSQPSYVSIVTNLRSLIADARRLEAEVRDFKQIQVGDLALEESRKSIELSNSQIREAKSGKFQDSMCAEYADVPQ